MAPRDDKCLRFFVSGRVQGVFFRAATQREAERLDLAGFARNLSDGRVEVVARGRETALAELGRWLWRGPSRAVVESVETALCEEPPGDTFEVL